MPATHDKAPSLWVSLTKFLRFEYLAFSLLHPLLGAVTLVSDKAFTFAQIAGLLLTLFSFHIYISVLNDVADLPLDRLNHFRRDYPLVRGTIKPWQAMIIVLLQVPISFGLTYWQNGSLAAYAFLALGLVMMTIYDLAGKRLPIPFVMDLVQGIGFSSMVLYGGAIMGTPNRLTWLMFIWMVVWMMMTNLLGGLRDTKGDLAFGASTTPVLLRAKPSDIGLHIPGKISWYSYGLGAALLVIPLIALQDITYAAATRLEVAAFFLVMGLFAIFLLWTFMEIASENFRAMFRSGLSVLAFSLTSITILFLGNPNFWLLFLIVFAFSYPCLKFNPRPQFEFWQKRLVPWSAIQIPESRGSQSSEESLSAG